MAAVTLDLASRELLILGLCVGVGSFPAWLLARRLGASVGLALAPLLGLGVATGVATTAVWFAAARSTPWLLPALAGLSLTLTWIDVGRSRHGNPHVHPERFRLRQDLIQIAAVLLIVLGCFDAAFAHRQSVGPVGFRVGDAQGYVAVIDGELTQSLRSAAAEERSHHTEADLSHKYWVGYVGGVQELDATAVLANVNSLTGLSGSDDQSTLMIVSVAIAALGMWASVRRVVRSRWLPLLAAVLFCGAFFAQLFYDGSEAALLGLAAIIPLVVVADDLFSDPSAAACLAVAVLGSSIVAFYPLFLPMAAAALVASAVAWAVRGGRRHRLRTRLYSRLASLGGIVAIGAALEPVAAVRAYRYWKELLHGGVVDLSKLPQYPHLTLPTAPAWLAQWTSLYSLSSTAASKIAAVVIVCVGGLIIVLVARHRPTIAIPLACLVLISMLISVHEQVSNNCSYCFDRSALPIGPAIICSGAIAIDALGSLSRSAARRAGLCLAVGFLIPVVISAARSWTLFVSKSYFVPSALRTLANEIPADGDILLEGFNENADSIIEQMLAYEVVDERAPNRVTVTADTDDSSSYIYVPFSKDAISYPLDGPQFNPSYRWVLTRMSSVQTERTSVARAGGIALERRNGEDVIGDAGLIVPPPTNGNGYTYIDPYVDEPVRFVATGPLRHGAVVAIFKVPVGISRYAVSGHAQATRDQNQLVVCLPFRSGTLTHAVDVRIRPDNDIQLIRMGTTRGCGSVSTGTD